MKRKLRLQLLDGEFAVCKLKNLRDAAWAGPFVSLTVTDEEISLVCPAERAPRDCPASETGWRCIKVAGPLDFSLVGILAELSAALAEKRISIFAVSTYNTDYLLVKAGRAGDAVAALKERGCEFAGDPVRRGVPG
ncbi:MAG: ACT domain-containing protein [Oscillospiraceae bacterium]|nr:ACT domain-containing protein [Oscillospiraceae bacterium]MCI1991010.1 ACT domain-containing protein [Oscillospiraceae bacterium]MCI2035594.1 ACT domain-containing protein [Oscillospiraceae bacterium]